MNDSSWQKYKDDYNVWRRFWVLFELRRKWNWADWFYKQVDREHELIVEPDAYGLFNDIGYMKLSLWIAVLRSVHEGMTKGLDDFNTPKKEKVEIDKVLPPKPNSINDFPKQAKFKDFRNAIFHCQWYPDHPKFDCDETTIQAIEYLHKEIGKWLNKEFRTVFFEFKIKYPDEPMYWMFGPNGEEYQPDISY